MTRILARARVGALAAAFALTAAGAHATTGYVFDDENGNGIRDPGERGVPSVEVSNGVDIAITDPAGAYRIADRPGSRVFVIKPRGWQTPVDGANLPRFYASGGQTADFPLRHGNEPDDLRALIVTDPQPASAAQVGYLSRGLVERLGRRSDVAFGV
ncbi:MAG: metallophosphoesterase N-terminal domain-containing protein, partial [Opitutaceae bacterium]